MFLEFYLTYILIFYLTKNSHILSDIRSDILSGILSDIYCAILSGIIPDMYYDIQCGILSGIFSDSLSGILSDIFCVLADYINSVILSDIFITSLEDT